VPDAGEVVALLVPGLLVVVPVVERLSVVFPVASRSNVYSVMPWESTSIDEFPLVANVAGAPGVACARAMPDTVTARSPVSSSVFINVTEIVSPRDQLRVR
jgi:hypothetical protein